MKTYNMKLMSAALLFAASAFGVTIQKDASYSTTVILEDFSGSVDPASAMTRVTLGSISGGAATYNYAAEEGPEGFITYNPLSTTFDPSVYKSLRVRMSVDRDSSSTTPVQVYPTPIPGAGFVSETVSSGTALTETRFDLSGLTPNGNGVRIDPFNYTNDGTQDQLQIDYIMADLGRTIGWEFDHDADLQGINAVNFSAADVLNGTLSGTASTSDAQLWLLGNGASGPSINADIYKYAEIRIKGDAGDRIDLFWNTAARSSLVPKIDMEASADGEWHTYTLDFTDETDWTGSLTALRLDPMNSENAAFEVDYVRFMETIPEPATMGMLLFSGCAMLAVRRRFIA